MWQQKEEDKKHTISTVEEPMEVADPDNQMKKHEAKAKELYGTAAGEKIVKLLKPHSEENQDFHLAVLQAQEESKEVQSFVWADQPQLPIGGGVLNDAPMGDEQVKLKDPPIMKLAKGIGLRTTLSSFPMLHLSHPQCS